MKTKDFGLASYMLAQGMKISDHSCDNRGQIWFHFDDSDNARQMETDFFTNDDAMVRVQEFLAAQRRLKSLIYETKKNEYGYGRSSNKPFGQ